jgi:hypothetical protein
MNRYLFLHRIKGPVMILVFGITALLDQWNILSFGRSWPLYLIALGLLQLAERAAWSEAFPPEGYSGTYAGQPGNWGGPSEPSSPVSPSSTALTIPPPDEGRR